MVAAVFWAEQAHGLVGKQELETPLRQGGAPLPPVVHTHTSNNNHYTDAGR